MFERIRNRLITDKYPFLKPRMFVNDMVIRNYDYSWTELDMMPSGWRRSFGYKMCEEIKQALVKANSLNKYRIVEIKEKYGELIWYDSGGTPEVRDIINKYAKLSKTTCIQCGRPTTKIACKWTLPFCDRCLKGTDIKVKDITEVQ